MCSFLYTSNYSNQPIDDLNYYLKFRGPDYTNVKHVKDNLFVHNLLSITGNFTPQPYENDGVYIIYNGEIYNYKKFGNYNTDGECLIPLYKEFGDSFIEQLDGEFAICLIDTFNEIVILATDLFKTKPLFFSVDHLTGISCASYKTPLEKLGSTNIQTASANTVYKFCLKTSKLISTKCLYTFDLNQYKTNYNDWVTAFEKSIQKRCCNTEKKIFIGLSSGYDSGLIFSEMSKQNYNFTSFTLRGTENNNIINARLKLKPSNCKCYSLFKNDNDYQISHNIISDRTELFYYTIHSSSSNYNERSTQLIDDGGSNNFATICRAARQLDCKICLSGTGADEIISDYGFNGVKFYRHSNFGGKFPENLADIFPWASFYGSTLESYIAKEEYVGGSFGIEMRYPFLDKDVVQEFLWLHQDLKNKEYKAPIDYYFNQNNFPYAKQEKTGF